MENNFKLKLKGWIFQYTEQCKVIAPLYSESFDRKLTLTEKIRVKFHLLICKACTNYFSNLHFMHDVFQNQNIQIETETPKLKLSQEAKERIKNNLKSMQ